MPITRMSICAPRSATKSKPLAPISGSKLRAQNSRILGSSSLILRGVNIRDSNLRWMSWIGGSSKNDRPGRDVDIGLDDFQDRAPGRAEGLVIDKRVIDVTEPAQDVEVVLLVVVQRRFLAQPPKHRVGVGVQLDVVGVEIDIVGRADCHRLSPLAGTALYQDL